MKLTPKQLANLVAMATSVKGEALGCDGCFALMDQLAQADIEGRAVPDALQIVQSHITQCKCCKDEYDSLLAALREIG